jgi:hypothetical protein
MLFSVEIASFLKKKLLAVGKKKPAAICVAIQHGKLRFLEK